MKVGARFYDPEIGRWIQKDPILSGVNWWVYCENDPVNYVDPGGKIPSPGDWLIGIGFVGLGLSIIPSPICIAGLIPSVVAIGSGIVLDHYYGEALKEILKELLTGGILSWMQIIEGWQEEHKPPAPYPPTPVFPPTPLPNFTPRLIPWYPPGWQFCFFNYWLPSQGRT